MSIYKRQRKLSRFYYEARKAFVMPSVVLSLMATPCPLRDVSAKNSLTSVQERLVLIELRLSTPQYQSFRVISEVWDGRLQCSSSMLQEYNCAGVRRHSYFEERAAACSPACHVRNSSFLAPRHLSDKGMPRGLLMAVT